MPFSDLTLLQARNELLEDALTRVLIASGVIRPDINGITGAELLLAAEEYCRVTPVGHNFSYMLRVEAPVQRSDGRYYIPISSDAQSAGIDASAPLARVSTDAFPGTMDLKVQGASRFAAELVLRWNLRADIAR